MIEYNIEFNNDKLSSYYTLPNYRLILHKLNERCDNNELNITTKADSEYAKSKADIIDYEPSATLNVVYVTKRHNVSVIIKTV